MAMAHPSLIHDPTQPIGKPVSHPGKRQFVPIRPAFRPLLPKPCTKEPSPPNGIHIHTRPVLNTGRKRVSTTKADSQKRRKSYTIPIYKSPKSARADSAELVSGSEGARLGGLHGGINVSAGGGTGFSGSGATSSLPRTVSAQQLHSSASTIASPLSLDTRSLESFSPRSYMNSRYGTSTGSVVSRVTGVSPTGVSLKGGSEPGSAYGFDSMTRTASPDVFETIANPISVAPALDEAAPATPVSISESPTSVSTASIFGSRESSTPNGTVDPMVIIAEGDEFGLDAGSLPLSNLNTLDDASVNLTPPDSQKAMPPASSLSGFGPAGSELDNFTDFYFRNDPAQVNPSTLTNNNNTPVESADSVSFVLNEPQPAGDLDIADKEDEFSILDYLAPAGDMF